jgi:hypothetical protein
MQCPHCGIHFHDNWQNHPFARAKGYVSVPDTNYIWVYRTAYCPACKDVIIEIVTQNIEVDYPADVWRQVYPLGANRGPVPPEIPSEIAQDYIEACNVLPISAKASAALARRCLQSMLHAHAYKAKDLAKEIDLLLAETDPTKALPHKLRMTVDGIRNFGNFRPIPLTTRPRYK